MNSLLKSRRRDPEPAIAVLQEQERRLMLPCADLAMGIEQMVAEGKLQWAGYGWTLTDFGMWVRVMLDRETLRLPRG